ncbi:MAG: hypothetical protein KBT04_04270 [Bacteroidales bacterium]|nr:hypothetical protein [Candidatus Colimorpha onthohippi]
MLTISFFCATNSIAQKYDISDTITKHKIIGTYYADMFVGRHTASGEIYSHEGMTAANRTLPLGTLVEVTNPKTGETIIVKINDRCRSNKVLDLTPRAHKALGLKGTTEVLFRIVGKAPIVKDQNTLTASDSVIMAKATKKRNSKKNKRTTPPRNNKSAQQTQNESKNNNVLPPVSTDVAEVKSQAIPSFDEPQKHQKESLIIDVDATRKKHQTDTSESPMPLPAKDSTDTIIYDIQICTVSNMGMARYKCSLLPKDMQKHIDYKLLADGKQIQIIYRDNLNKKQANAILNQLSKTFPSAYMVKQKSTQKPKTTN